MKHLFTIIVILLYVSVLNGQEDCATALPIIFGTNYSGDNIGASSDNDYSGVSGCSSTNYNSSHWYAFTTPVGVSSINLTYTEGSIGASATLTIVDDCLNNFSYSYFWSECSGTSISGSAVTVCNLEPSTTYYIQVASTVANEGTFDLLVNANSNSPINDICSGATPVNGGVLECNGGLPFYMPGNSQACPDPEATGNCVSNTTPGVWYYFEIPLDFEYNMIQFNPSSGVFELFSTFTDCSALTYVGCDPFLILEPIAGITYYVLVSNETSISGLQSAWTSDCINSVSIIDNGGDGSGAMQFGLNSCVGGNPIMPCENDNIVWYDYTIGCNVTDITISIDQWSIGSGEMIEGGIMAIEDDCNTIMSQYDPNGAGYVCSGIIANQDLILNDLPPGIQFLIAIGSDNPDQGYYEITVVESTGGGSSNNDLCDNAIELGEGFNPGFTNECATADLDIPGCIPQSASTVWFEFDPGSIPQDITINLLSTGIGNTGIAAWVSCNGANLASACGTILELSCITGPFHIEVGSSVVNQGTFDLDVSMTPAQTPSDLEVITIPICSYENTVFLVSFPGGLSGDLEILVHNSSSPDIIGMNPHSYSNVNSAVIGDVLVNCATTTQVAVYEIVASIPGFNCPTTPILVEVPVYPKLNEIPNQFEFCLPADVFLEGSEFINGGSSPYTSYDWLWNGSISISTSPILSGYQLTESGFFVLQVIDNNGCFAETTIDIIVYDEISPFIQADVYEACPNDPQFIYIQSLIQGGGIISNTTWSILDDFNSNVNVGFESGENEFIIPTIDLLPGVYSIEASVTDDHNCSGDAVPIFITIHPTPFGEIIEEIDDDCNLTLKIIFYDANGNDINGNGPDSNGDGIPDQYDLDDNGIPDFQSISWISPSLGSFTTNELSFVPTEDGIYFVEILTATNCPVTFESNNIILTPFESPTIIGPSEVCEGKMVQLHTSPDNYSGYQWYDQNNLLIGDQPTINVTLDGPQSVFYLTVEGTNGCFKNDTILIDTNPNPIVQLTGSTTFCSGDSTQLDAGGDPASWMYEWKDENGNIFESGTSNVYISIAGNYEVVVTNEFGCKDSTTIAVIEDTFLAIEILGSDLCDNQEIVLDAGIGFDTYQWYDENEMPIANGQTLSISSAGIYIAEVINGLCIGRDSIEIVNYSTPIVDLINQVSICNGSNPNENPILNLTMLTNNSDDGEWSSIDLSQLDLSDLTSIDFSNVVAGNYQLIYLTNTAIAPCMNVSDTLNVLVSDCDCPTLEIGDDITLCNLDSIINLDEQLKAGTEPGTWMQVDGPENILINGNSEIQINSSLPGLYIFEYTLTNPQPNCPESGLFNVEIIGTPAVAFADVPILCNKISPIGPNTLDLSTILLNGSGDWIDPNITNLDFSNINNLDFTDVNIGLYTIVFLTDNAMTPCIDQEYSIEIEVIDCDCPFIAIGGDLISCNDENNINLNAQLVTGTESGVWAQVDGPESLVINGNSDINIESALPGTYIYEYTLTNPQPNCPDNDLLIIEIVDSPEAQFTDIPVLCNQNSSIAPNTLDLSTLLIKGNGEWIDPSIPNLDFTDINNLDFTDVTPGLSAISFMTNDAMPPCVDQQYTIEIEVIDCDCPPLVLLDPMDQCNDGFILDLNLHQGISDPGFWIEESNNPLIFGIDNNTVDFNGAIAGNYSFIYELETPVSGCDFRDTIDININMAPFVAMSNDTFACNINNGTSQHILNLSNFVSGSAGDWIDKEGNIIVNPNAVDFTMYNIGNSITFTYQTNVAVPPCIDVTESFTVTIRDCNCQDPTFLDPPKLCNIEGQSVDLQDLVTNNILGTWEIIDSGGSNTFSLNGSVFDAVDLTEGMYLLEFEVDDQSNPNCQFYWQLELEVVNQRDAEIESIGMVCTTNFEEENTIINLFDDFLSGYTGGSWFDSNGLEIDEPTMIDFLNSSAGVYNFTYQILNEFPCNDRLYQIEILAKECSEEALDTIIDIANVFSPNGDGINDNLYVNSNIPELSINSFVIFDRWGNKVFDTSNTLANEPDQGWDGTFNKKRVVEGVYLYMVEVVFMNGKRQFLVGDITVI